MTQEEFNQHAPWAFDIEVKTAHLPGGVQKQVTIYTNSYICLPWKSPEDVDKFMHKSSFPFPLSETTKHD